MARKLLLSGAIYGRLTVLGEAEPQAAGPNRWEYRYRVQCVCGRELIVSRSNLASGNTQSCGCLQRDYSATGAARRRHGMSHSPTWKTWSAMLTRCRNPKTEVFQRYGARGITVCDRWLVFDNFLADMGVRPENTSLDRIDGTKGYAPGNCRWATADIQSFNQTTTRVVMLDGEALSFSAAARRVGRCPATVHEMMTKRGLTHQEVIDLYRVT